MNKTILSLFAISTLISCTKLEDKKKEVEGYRPIYKTQAELNDIKSELPKPIVNAGKIWYKDNFIFINEKGSGVHIIDNTTPSNPKNIAFINIPANSDMAVKENILYADNGSNLVSLDITDPKNCKLVKVVAGVYSNPNHPEEREVKFECVDPSKGIVVGWEKAMLINPKCSR